jgi:large subunit ribosomal protein L21e
MKHSHGGNSKHSRHLVSKGRTTIGQALKAFKVGDRVRICVNPSHLKGRLAALRFNNCIGVVEGKQGDAYKIAFWDGAKEKHLVLLNYHLSEIRG